MDIEMNKLAYKNLIDEDIKALQHSSCRSIERNHIEDVLRLSVKMLYPESDSKKESCKTDWEQVRIQAAIAAMQGILANTCIIRWNDNYTIRSEFFGVQRVSTNAINYADALIEELKKEK